MYNKIIITLALFLSIHSLQAQSLDDYKYVIVPKKFNFQKENNEFKVNALTHFLLNKYGFAAFMQGEQMPSDLNVNGCNTLYAELEEGGFLSTRVVLKLVNCAGNLVYTSPEGKSKIKDYEKSYNEALRNAFEGFEEQGYTYSDEVIQTPEISDKPAQESTNSDMAYAESITPSTPEEKQTKARQQQAQKTVVVKGVEKVGEQVNTDKNDQVKDNALTTADQYVSGDGSYRLEKSSNGFTVYADDKKIGTAIKTSGESYLINTSEFTGVGAIKEGKFIVEREIKGVQGLVQMIFEPTD